SQGYGPGGRATIHWDCAQAHAPDLLRSLLKEGVPQGVLINVNFPNCAPHEVAGIAATCQGRRDSELLRLEARFDGRGIPYYWIGFTPKRATPAAGTDLAALVERKISVTPLRLDLTDEVTLARMARLFE
ncbi:MAG TPA: 5'/3'-nucleotidase SurE, partial [Beijerinckiaceae bacterium]|nr:5'/3'-nucleotidase SurE [Beijerinckiaceae bacterium]